MLHEQFIHSYEVLLIVIWIGSYVINKLRTISIVLLKASKVVDYESLKIK